MKNFNSIISYVCVGIVFLCSISMLSSYNRESDDILSEDYEIMDSDIAQEVLRLHILANSDADYDQQLKLKVKSAVASAVAEDMKKSGIGTKEEAINYMRDNSDRYISIAKDVVVSEGYGYDVTATIGKHWFPVKIYGNALYPEGEYDAYRMLIGSAEGKNWWCVLFPSLCMVDEACYVEEETGLEASKEDNESDNIQFKLGIVEWFKNMW